MTSVPPSPPESALNKTVDGSHDSCPDTGVYLFNLLDGGGDTGKLDIDDGLFSLDLDEDDFVLFAVESGVGLDIDSNSVFFEKDGTYLDQILFYVSGVDGEGQLKESISASAWNGVSFWDLDKGQNATSTLISNSQGCGQFINQAFDISSSSLALCDDAFSIEFPPPPDVTPVPASQPLLVGGTGILGEMARRRRKAA